MKPERNRGVRCSDWLGHWEDWEGKDEWPFRIWAAFWIEYAYWWVCANVLHATPAQFCHIAWLKLENQVLWARWGLLQFLLSLREFGFEPSVFSGEFWRSRWLMRRPCEPKSLLFERFFIWLFHKRNRSNGLTFKVSRKMSVLLDIDCPAAEVLFVACSLAKLTIRRCKRQKQTPHPVSGATCSCRTPSCGCASNCGR
jgi:hypothetical protein